MRRRSGLLVVDKPRGLSSHAVVGVARRVFGTRDVGHAGTLDPMATGVLVLGVGEGTKLLGVVTGDDKAYDAVVGLGVETDSLDADGVEVRRAPVPAAPSRTDVERALAPFVGSYRQRAPVISAIKQGGRALYARARRGEAVEPPEREVVVHSIEVLDVGPTSVTLHVRCGKGFYVRALARDLATALGTVGHLTALRRTASGGATLEQAVDLAWLERARGGDDEARARVAAALVTLGDAWGDRPRVIVNASGVAAARHGRRIAPEMVLASAPGALGPIALFDEERTLLALAASDLDGYRVTRGFVGEGA